MCRAGALGAVATGSARPVGVDDVDAHAPAVGQGADHGPQGARRATRPADDPAEFVRVHPDLEHLAASAVLPAHHDVVGVLHDAADEVLERLLEHAQASAFAASSGVLAASAGISEGSEPAGWSVESCAMTFSSAFAERFGREVLASLGSSSDLRATELKT